VRTPIAAIALVVVGLLAACGHGPTTGTAAEGPACEGPATAATQDWPAPLVPTPEPLLPVSLTDFSGTEVTVSKAERILALDVYGTLATTVHALGLGDRLVGRDVSTGVPELASLPVVTHNGHELNAEAILALDPDVVLTDYSIGPLEVQLQLRDSGVPVVILDGNRGRDVVGDQIREVAEALGVEAAGEELADRVAADIEEAESEVARLVPRDPSDRLRMVFLYMRGQAGVFYWFGEGSGADDLIEALGGVDVADEVDVAGARPINAEGLVLAAPDMFLMMSDGLESVGGIDGLLEVPGVAETPAGADRCVVDMDDSQILGYGPQYPATLRALAHAVYGEPDGSGGDRSR